MADNKIAHLNINGTQTNEPIVISNGFNDHFVNVGPNLANQIHSNKNPLDYISHNSHSIFIPEINELEVQIVINDLKHSSPGWDELSSTILKPNIDSYIKPLTYIINQSFKDGIFPNELKLAKIIPIYKAGDKSLPTNYRPISVLSLFSKIFEKIMYNHLLSFINTYNILYKFQFGFRKQYSTSHAIITLVEQINNAINSGKIMIGVFLDLSKAFDTVNHSILIKKLYAYGIRGNILQWLKSYLNNRKQYVYINETKSEVRSISCGIPQGSVFGPLLFILYVNDLSTASHNLFSILFADDTSVFMKGESINEVINMLNIELHKITVWLESNKLTLNVVKSHFMIFHRAKLKLTKPDVKLCSTTLEQVKYTKFLGIIIDEKLNLSIIFLI